MRSLKRFLNISTAVLLCLSIGLHWAVLQSVAWTTMLIERTQSDSLVSALKTTFDGQHPCKICQVVAAGKKSERKSETVVKTPKLEVSPLSRSVFVLFPPRVLAPAAQPVMTASRGADAPPLPPPRRA